MKVRTASRYALRNRYKPTVRWVNHNPTNITPIIYYTPGLYMMLIKTPKVVCTMQGI